MSDYRTDHHVDVSVDLVFKILGAIAFLLYSLTALGADVSIF